LERFQNYEWLKKINEHTHLDKLVAIYFVLMQCTFRHQNEALLEKSVVYIRDQLEEPQVADWFQNFLGPESECEGNYYGGVFGVIGLVSTNNTLENYWRNIKGGDDQPSIINLNEKPVQFVMYELPKIMAHDRQKSIGVSRTDTMTSRQMLRMSTVQLGRCLLVDEPYQISADEFLVQKTHHAGSTENMEEVVVTLKRAERGDYDPNEENPLVCAMATGNYHHVYRISSTVNPDMYRRAQPWNRKVNFVCTCYDAMKSVKCDGIIVVLDFEGQLIPSLEDRARLVFREPSGRS